MVFLRTRHTKNTGNTEHSKSSSALGKHTVLGKLSRVTRSVTRWQRYQCQWFRHLHVLHASVCLNTHQTFDHGLAITGGIRSFARVRRIGLDKGLDFRAGFKFN